MFRSDNSGDTWSLTDTSFFRSRNIHDIKAASNNWLYVGTQRGLYRSKDEGLTWEELSNGIFVDNINCIYIYNDTTILIGTAIGSYYSTDLGDSWTEIDKKTDVVNVNSFVKTEDSKLLAAASYVIYSGSTNFTLWEEFNEGFENLFFQKFIPIMSNGNINILLSSDNKNLYRSDNSQNWIKKFDGLTYNTFSMSPWNYLYLSSGMC